jgi:predicted ATP-grasp superfamily ATP-dependent carboligase
MVEYRFDPRVGSAALMEINGRFWGSLPLAYHAGASFAWLTYAVLGLGEQEIAAAYRAGLRCRYMVPETKRLFTICFNHGAIQNRELRFARSKEVLRYLADFLRPRTRYYVFMLNDPMPFVADTLHIVEKVVLSLCRRLASVCLSWRSALTG